MTFIKLNKIQISHSKYMDGKVLICYFISVVLVYIANII